MTPNLVGVGMVGRWKSYHKATQGAPIDLTPIQDDPILGGDPERNKNFNFNHPGENITSNQGECPFLAQIQKTNPRIDLNKYTFTNHIICAGIPFGPELSDAEKASVAYQSDITNGFRRLQTAWADTPNFVLGKDVNPGFDPIITDCHETSLAWIPKILTQETHPVPDFVVTREGEYFFAPPLSALLSPLGA
ncbi:hypothetical protein C8J56DRAFT_898498 [Mycena floridula]|nr:hypothetical protein C8J56DRAFT_898498 [Mycena floridula]